MPQLQLPIFPAGTTLITAELAVDCQEGKMTYLNGHLPVFQHVSENLAAFRMFTRPLVVNATVSQAAIARAFHVPPGTVNLQHAGPVRSRPSRLPPDHKGGAGRGS